MSEKTDKAISMCEELQIPCVKVPCIKGCKLFDQNCKYDHSSSIRVNDLYDILMDEEKL
jgi:hypothetical protein